MPANPYASFLGTRDPRQVIAETPNKVAALLGRLGPDKIGRSPAPGKWSAASIVCHLADCEVAFAFRLRQALAEPHYVIQPFDQDAWAKPYSNLDAHKALATFAALRQWNLALLDTLAPQDFSKVLTHPERGDMTFQTVVETMGGHDLNHLRQIETIVG
jgi:hypothetical protein